MINEFDHVTAQDYQTVAGPDWPSYQQFQTGQDIPLFVLEEIRRMLRPKQGFQTNTFCVLPFYGWEIPKNTACCLLPSDADLPSIRSAMLNDRRAPECHKCWTLEDQNIVSDRQLKNAALDHYSNVDLEYLIKQAHDGQAEIVHYKLDTSNTCNSACVTCDDQWSSTWAQLNRKNNRPARRAWRIIPESSQLKINWSKARSMGFRGGEPLLSATNFWVVEQLLDHNNTDCFLTFTTNGSIKLTDYQIDLLKNFKSVDFCYSIDGIGPVFEYLRWPLRWQQIKENIDITRSLGFMASVSYTVSNLNVLYHDQTTQWFRDQNLNYICNPVYTPDYFAPSILPINAKQAIHQANKCQDIIDLLNLDQDPGTMYEKFWSEIKQQDRVKKINIEHYLPDLVELLAQVDQ
jgi:hypothetical protein